MSALADLRTLYHLTLAPVRGETHAARMEHFYARQAAGYDRFRRRLLHGREALWSALPVPRGGRWVDLGGGTASNLEFLGPRLRELSKVYVVDVSRSLLDVANRRISDQGWRNVETVAADAAHFLPDEPIDVVTCSYSLTMIPEWFAALDQAMRMLRPGGTIGVVDFYVSRKHPAAEMVRHGWSARTFWPTWFALDNVVPSADHVPYLHDRFAVEHFSEHRSSVPYLPLLRAPYYIFIGRKSRHISTSSDRMESSPLLNAGGGRNF